MSKMDFSYNTPSLEQQYQGINSAGKRSFMMIRSCQQQPEDRLGRNAPRQNRPSDDVNRDRAPLFLDQFEDAIEDAQVNDANEYKEISHKASVMSSPRIVPLSPCIEELASNGNNGNSKEEEREKMMIAELIIQLGNHKHLAAAVSDDDTSITSTALTTHKIPQSPPNNATIIEDTIPTAIPSLDDKDNNGGGNSSIDLLQALQYSLHNPKWIENYYHLRAYKNQNGHCNVNEGSQLSRWIQEQRVAFEKNNLEMNQKHLLDDIGFVWSSGLLSKTKKKGNNQNNNGGGAFSDTKWFGHYTKLVEYKKRNGHCNVPQHGEGKLGPWVKRQREEHKKNKLCKHRQELLNQIGFVWKMARSAPFDNTRWLEKYAELKLYRQQNGHCNVPTRQGKLGMWVNRQRSEYSKQKMRPDRKNLLDSIGFAWTTGRYSSTKFPFS